MPSFFHAGCSHDPHATTRELDGVSGQHILGKDLLKFLTQIISLLL